MSTTSPSEVLQVLVPTNLGMLTLNYTLVDPLPGGVTREQIIASVTASFEERARMYFKVPGDRSILTTMVCQQYAHHDREWIKQTACVTLADDKGTYSSQ